MTKDRSRKSRVAGGLVRRSAGLLAFLPIASRAPGYARLLWELLVDDRTPGSSKAVLAGALGYLVVGRDIVPDDVPLLGGLDDLVVVILAVDLFLDGVPTAVLHEKLDALGIDRRAFDEDVAQIRRLTPKPVRRAIRRIPNALSLAGDAVRQTGLGPKVRGWVSKEEPLA
jgi:uncharacterized membrane protein YkvA (DUF1232 family)